MQEPQQYHYRLNEDTRGIYQLTQSHPCRKCLERGLVCDSLRPTCGRCSRDVVECIYNPIDSVNRILQSRLKRLQESIGRLGVPSRPQGFPELQLLQDPPMLLYESPSYGSSLAIVPPSVALVSHNVSMQSVSSNLAITVPIDNTSTPGSLLRNTSGAKDLPVLSNNTRSAFGCSAVLWGNNSDDCQWWEHHKFPPCHKYHLMNFFLQDCTHFMLQVNMQRFVARIVLPSSHPNSLHPVLLNSIYLLACTFSPVPGIQALESRFLARTRRHLALALAQPNRLFDYLLASLIVARYYHYRARSLEGHLAVQTAARFAVGCGLHRIRSRSCDEMKIELARTLLGPPSDAIELGERINTFWIIFTMEKKSSMAMNAPSAYSEEEIETVWPIPMECYEMEFIKALPCTSLRSLYVPGNGSIALGLTTPINVYAKATALLYSSRQLASQYNPDLPATTEFWLKFRTLQKIISEYKAALPSFSFKSLVPGASLGNNIFIVASGHMLATTASLVLHCLFIDDDAESREKGLACVRKIVDVVSELDDIDPKVGFTLGPPLFAACEFLRREIKRIKGSSESQLLSELRAHQIKLVRRLSGVLAKKGCPVPHDLVSEAVDDTD
ncbi:hypothetical protein BOTBODRAFT_38432 [Botryobasidium botryosum FD-172 SS1]|uniref:Zn(2)-C6 fungal-type domain-containing protein n=1 Tax=Botryobasidium botryosum (strain FD-172 SS1) TaxID=930990 RepID=A0A067M8I0_BOTB1|nr:hypothetical protein BOTBODRAFT_38432 [Botryobasidium botryosum FD-172 SS1]